MGVERGWSGLGLAETAGIWKIISGRRLKLQVRLQFLQCSPAVKCGGGGGLARQLVSVPGDVPGEPRTAANRRRNWRRAACISLQDWKLTDRLSDEISHDICAIRLDRRRVKLKSSS